MHVRLKNGDIHVQISNATSRALTGDVSLSVGVSPSSILSLSIDLFSPVTILVEWERHDGHRGCSATITVEKHLSDRSDQLLRGNHPRSNQ